MNVWNNVSWMRERFSKRMKIAQALAWFNIKPAKRVVDRSQMTDDFSDLLLLGMQELNCIGQKKTKTAKSAEWSISS